MALQCCYIINMISQHPPYMFKRRKTPKLHQNRNEMNTKELLKTINCNVHYWVNH